MVADAEANKADDDAHREKVEARNQLEQAAYAAKEADKEGNSPVTEKAKEIIAWLDEHPDEEKSIYEARREELEQAMRDAGPPAGGSAPPDCGLGSGASMDGPKIEEVD